MNRLIRFAAARDVQLRRPVAERLVAAAKDALPTRDAVVARRVLASDVALLADLDARIVDAETELARLLPLSPFTTLTSVPGWGVVRVSNYAAALGDPDPWPGPKADLSRIGTVSDAVRVGRQAPRRIDQPRRQCGTAPSVDRSRHRIVDHRASGQVLRPGLKDRGKRGGVIACALAHRANRIAHALVRDHAVYDPARWS